MRGWLHLALMAAGVDVEADAGGVHGEHEGIDWFELVAMFTNFVLFFGFLAWKFGPNVSQSLKARRSNLESRLQEAQNKQAEAEARLEQYREKLANLEREFEQVVASYEKQAQADRERLKEETEKALDRLSRETEFSIQQEARKAERAIRDAVVETTLSLAEQKIRERMTDADKKRLNEQYIRSLESGPRARG
ncbi:MAG TPA: ATP synthase F0 subunit B [Myxococcales bacterium LLY-WYZ-16_1]|nr:ATP synthase F0 subunit B [Myxococcales bacterium LLY-WYZ-16_1]